MIVQRTIITDECDDDDDGDESIVQFHEEKSTQELTIFTELLGEQVLQHYVKGNFRGTDFISTGTLSGKVIGLYFS